MLRPEQIKNHQFSSAGRGHYRAEEVDSYIGQVCEDYEKALKENSELFNKLGVLAEKVEAYRNDEDNIRITLLTAQRMADKIQREAKEQAAQLIDEAEIKAETNLNKAKTTANDLVVKATAEAEEITTRVQSEKEAIESAASIQAEETISKAETEAKRLLDSADARSRRVIEENAEKIAHQSRVIEKMKHESFNFKKELLLLYQRHIELIGKIPEYVKEEMTEEKDENAKQEPHQAAEYSAEEAVNNETVSRVAAEEESNEPQAAENIEESYKDIEMEDVLEAGKNAVSETEKETNEQPENEDKAAQNEESTSFSGFFSK